MQIAASKESRSSIQRIVAALLCALVLLCGFLAASDSLHRAFHGHAAHDDGDSHEASDTETSCALCLFAHAQCDHSPAAPPAIARPVGPVLELPVPPSADLTLGVDADTRTRGPPVTAA